MHGGRGGGEQDKGRGHVTAMSVCRTDRPHVRKPCREEGGSFEMLVEVQLAEERSQPGPGGLLSHVMELGLCPEGRQVCEEPV